MRVVPGVQMAIQMSEQSYSRKALSRTRHLALVLGLALISMISTGCVTTPVTGRSQFNLLSLEDDKALGLQAYDQILGDAQIINSGTQHNQVQRVVGNLVSVAKADEEFRGDFDWEARLVKDDATVNAWCLPGGKMAVYTGILPFTQDDTGLAVVMGHEIGHAIARHGSERMTQEMGLQVALQLAGGQGWAQYAGAAAQMFVQLPWGRKQELEADHIGLMYMARAGYDPREAELFWRRMSAGKEGAPPEFLSTHPSDETRIAQIQDLLPQAMKEFKRAGGQP